MKRYLQLFSLLPCTLFLLPHLLSDARVTQIYERLLFETATELITADDLKYLHSRALVHPEALFELPNDGSSEREVVRQGLKQLRLFIGNDLRDISPKILALLESKIQTIAKDAHQQEIVNTKRLKPNLNPLIIEGGKYFRDSRQRDNHALLLVDPTGFGPTIEVWNTETGKRVTTLPAPKWYMDLKLSGDGRFIALLYGEPMSAEKNFGIFDLNTLKFIQNLSSAKSAINMSGRMPLMTGFQISHDSRYVIGINEETKNFVVWDLVNNHSVMLEDPADSLGRKNDDYWQTVRFLPNNTIVTIQPTHLSYWDPITGKLLRSINIHVQDEGLKLGWPDATRNNYPSAISDNGKYWAVAIHDPKWADSFVAWALLDLETGETLVKPHRLPGEHLNEIRFAPDGKSIFVAKFSSYDVFDVVTKQYTRKIARALGDGKEFAISPDGKILAFEYQTPGDTPRLSYRVIRLWDLELDKPITEIGTSDEATHNLRFSADGKKLITQGRDNRIRIWPLEQVL